MKLFFDHIFGNSASKELVYSPATAIFEKEEYAHAVQNGWHIAESWGVPDFRWYKDAVAAGTKVWYQARSSRIEVEKFQERARHRKKIKRAGITCEISRDISGLESELWKIFQAYVSAKGFENFYECAEDLFSEVYGSRSYLLYSNREGKRIGFGIIEVINDEVAIAPQFAWDYEDKSIGLGSLNKLFQFRLLRQEGISHLYLGTSYEIASLGKTKWPGFEWWTGRDWSADVGLYKYLLERESYAESLEDLYQIQLQYYSRIT